MTRIVATDSAPTWSSNVPLRPRSSAYTNRCGKGVFANDPCAVGWMGAGGGACIAATLRVYTAPDAPAAVCTQTASNARRLSVLFVCARPRRACATIRSRSHVERDSQFDAELPQ